MKGNGGVLSCPLRLLIELGSSISEKRPVLKNRGCRFLFLFIKFNSNSFISLTFLILASMVRYIA